MAEIGDQVRCWWESAEVILGTVLDRLCERTYCDLNREQEGEKHNGEENGVLAHAC